MRVSSLEPRADDRQSRKPGHVAARAIVGRVTDFFFVLVEGHVQEIRVEPERRAAAEIEGALDAEIERIEIREAERALTASE